MATDRDFIEYVHEFGRVLGEGDKTAPQSRRKSRRSEPTPAQRALGLLVRREHSRKELARKLAARGIEADEARAAVERMAAEGWQDDARFAEFLVRNRAASGYGPLHVRAELGTHGLDREAIVTAMETFDGDWLEAARDLIRRRFGEAGPKDVAQKRKAADLLSRRGFPGDIAREVLRGGPE
ncbi:MAG: recombination regulator RecX [Pseudoxanthomonas sp.]